MKPLHKGAVGMLTLAAAGLMVWTAAAKWHAVSAPEQGLPEQATLEVRQEPSLVVPVLAMEHARTTLGLVRIEAQGSVAHEDATPAPQAPSVLPVPADIKVKVTKTRKGAVMSV